MSSSLSPRAYLFLVCVFVLPLLGCVAVYVQPTGTSQATLRLENDSYDRNAYFATFTDGEKCREPDRRNIPVDASGAWALRPQNTSDIRIKSEKAFTLEASVPDINGTCAVMLTFYPETNKNYAATFSTDKTYCRLSIYRLDPTPGTSRVREKSVRRRQPAGKFGDSCD